MLKSGKAIFNRNCGQLLCWILTLLPILYLIFLVFKYNIGVPYYEQWDITILNLGKYYEGNLTFHDLWKSHNMQKMIFPEVIMLVMAHFSRGNFTYELAFNILLALGTFAAVVYQMRRTLKSLNYNGIFWVLPIISLTVFSLVQWENWSWGFEMLQYLNVFTVVLGLVLLATPIFKWSNYIAALLLGVVATYSYASGVSYWFIGLFMLFFVDFKDEKTKKLSLLLWMMIGLIAVGLFFTDRGKMQGFSPWLFFQRPGGSIKFVLTYLGSYLATNMQRALHTGLLGLILTAYLSCFLLRYKYVKFKEIVPYLAFSFYSLGSALITAYGRINDGTLSSLASRYTTLSYLFWLTIVFLLFLLVIKVNDLKLPGYKFKKYALVFSLGLLASVIAINSAWGRFYLINNKYLYLLPARNELASAKDDNLLKRLYPNPEILKKAMKVAQKHRLSIYRNEPFSYKKRS